MRSTHLLLLSSLIAATTSVNADESAASKPKEPTVKAWQGDWEIRIGDRTGSSVLSLKVSKGELKGSWISFFGVSEIEELSVRGNELSFERSWERRNGETVRWTTSLKREKDRVVGTVLFGDREREVTGFRIVDPPPVVGHWAMSYTKDVVSSTLIVRQEAG
ncbi:MAG: hypothetical protein AAF517_17635, partial [Planctomycetota bacterium]